MKRDAGKEGFWRQAVAEAQGSGESVRGFCQRRGLKEGLFYAWRRELKIRTAEGTGRTGFVELLPAADLRGGVGVNLRISGRVVSIGLDRGFDRAALQSVLACLGVETGQPAASAEGRGR